MQRQSAGHPRPALFLFLEVIMPVHAAHPRGWVNPINARALLILPAAPAWDATPTEFFVSFATHMTLSFTYIRGAANGAFDFQIQASPYSIAAVAPAGAQEWPAVSVYVPGVLVPGADTPSNIQREFVTYTAVGAAAETFIYGPLEIWGAVERMRVIARESGVPGTPGTLQITAELSDAPIN